MVHEQCHKNMHQPTLFNRDSQSGSRVGLVQVHPKDSCINDWLCGVRLSVDNALKFRISSNVLLSHAAPSMPVNCEYSSNKAFACETFRYFGSSHPSDFSIMKERREIHPSRSEGRTSCISNTASSMRMWAKSGIFLGATSSHIVGLRGVGGFYQSPTCGISRLHNAHHQM